MVERVSFISRFSLTLVIPAVLLLTGCQGTSGPAAQPSTDSGAVTPKVNRLIFGIGAPGAETAKISDLSQLDVWSIRPMYEHLLGVSFEGVDNVTTQVAESWSLEPNGLDYRFKLRKGVQFHYDQGEMKAEDIVFSWEHVKAPDSTNAHAPRWRTLVKDIEIVNDYEVVYRLSQPDIAFLMSGTSEINGGQEILSKKDAKSRDKWPTLQDRGIAGTGPYYITERELGRYIRFARVPFQHYRKSPEFPEFEWRFFKENSTMLAALLAKEIHMAALPGEMMNQAEKAGFKLIPAQFPIGAQVFIQFSGPWLNPKVYNNYKPGADQKELYAGIDTTLMDVRVRKAMSKAINRDELNKAFLAGRGVPYHNVVFHSSRPGWNPDWEKNFPAEYGYDPEAAKKLLADAGYGPNNPMKHTLQIRGNGYYPELTDMTEAISNYWRAIGIQMTLEQPDNATVTAKSRAGEYNNHTTLNPTSTRQFFGYGIYYADINNDGQQTRPAFPELTDFFNSKLRRTLDQSKWDALYKEAGDMGYYQHRLIPLFWLYTAAVVDPNIVGEYKYSGTLSGPFANQEYIKPAR